MPINRQLSYFQFQLFQFPYYLKISVLQATLCYLSFYVSCMNITMSLHKFTVLSVVDFPLSFLTIDNVRVLNFC